MLIVALFCVVACIMGYMYRGIETSLNAENTHQAFRLTLDVTTAYVKNSGEWPKSWDDLVGFDGRSGGRLTRFYLGLDELKRRVVFDFQLEVSEVAAMTRDSFTAIRQTPPNYGVDSFDFVPLIDAARASAGRPSAKAGR